MAKPLPKVARRFDGVYRRASVQIISEYYLHPFRFFAIFFGIAVVLGVIANFKPIYAQIKLAQAPDKKSFYLQASDAPKNAPLYQLNAHQDANVHKLNEPLEVAFDKPANKTQTGKDLAPSYKLFDPYGSEVKNANFVQKDIANGQTEVDFSPLGSAGQKPGKYTIEQRDPVTDEVISSQDIILGVLAFNPNYSVYPIGTPADLAMAVLDDGGKTVCNAGVMLQITDPSGKETDLGTGDGSIRVNEECWKYQFESRPDYEASYTPKLPGTYQVVMTARVNGAERSLNDTFAVSSNSDVYLQRSGPTRTWPGAQYDYHLTFQPQSTGDYVVTENVPASFTITHASMGDSSFSETSTTDGLESVLSWHVSATAGRSYDLTYRFQTPPVYPFLFKLGPLEAKSTAIDWSEPRQWLIASDSTCSSQSGGGTWNTSTTIWSCGHVPTTTDTVVITSGNPITLGTNTASVISVTINSGGSLSLSSFTLTIGNTAASGTALTNNGTFSSGTGKVVIGGTTNVSLTVFSGSFTGTNKLNNLQFNCVEGTGGRTYTGGAAIDVGGNFDVTPSSSSGTRAFLYNLGGNNTITGTLTINTGAHASAEVNTVSANNWALSTGNTVLSAANNTLTINNSLWTLTGTSGTLFTNNSGTLTTVGATSEVDVTSTSGTPTILSAATTLHILKLNAAATVVNLGANFTTDNNSGNLLWGASGTLNLEGRALTIGTGGTWQIDSGATMCIGGTTGATTATCDSGAVQTSTFTFPTATYNFNLASNLIILNDANQSVSSNPTYGNLKLSPVLATSSSTKTYTFGGATAISGNFDIKPKASAASAVLSLTDSGATNTITVDSTKTTTIAPVSGTQTPTANFVTHPSTTDYNLSTGLLDLESGGMLDATGSSATISLSGTGTVFTINSGTYTYGTSTIVYTNATSATIKALTGTSGTNGYYNLQTNGTGTYTLGGSTTINNDLALTQGTLDDNGNQITGNATGTLSAASGTTLKLGTGTATTFPTSFTNPNISLDPNSLVVYKATINQTISSTPTYGDLQLSAASGSPTKTLNGATTIAGDLTIDASNALDTDSVNHYNITLAGNYTNNGTFTARTGTVTLNGTTTQTLSGTMTGTSAFSTLTITNSSGSITETCPTTSAFTPGIAFAAAATISNYNIATTGLSAGVYVQYNSGSTYIVTNISWVGVSARMIYFRNSNLNSGTWLLKYTPGSSSIFYVDVARSDASVAGGTAITADGTSKDCGTNTNWTFTTRINITGNAYADEGTTVWSKCDGSTANISLVENGQTALTTSCNASTGAYAFNSYTQSLSSDDPISIFFNTAGGNIDVGVAVTVANSVNVTLNPRKNIVWIKEESTTNISNTFLDHCDSVSPSQCANVPYNVTSGALTLSTGTKLVVETGKTFAPGGNVTADSLHLQGTYTAGSETLTLLGSGTGISRPLYDDGGTFTANSDSVAFLGTSTTEVDTGPSYNTLQLYPASGSQTYRLGTASSQTLTVTGDLLIGNGSTLAVDASTYNPTINITGNLTINSTVTYTKGTGTTTLKPTGTKTWTDNTLASQDLGNVVIGSGLSSPKILLGSSVMASNITINTSHTLDANGSNTLTLTGTSGTLLNKQATSFFLQSTGTVKVTSSSGTPFFMNLPLTLHKLIIDSTATVINIHGILTVDNTSGSELYIKRGVLDMDTNQMVGPGTSNGTLQIDAGATFCIGGTTPNTSATCDNGGSDGSFTMPVFQTYIFDTNSNIRQFTGSGVTISSTPTYGNLYIISKSCCTITDAFAGATTVSGNLTVTTENTIAVLTLNMAGDINVGGSVSIIDATNGSATLVTRPATTDYNLTAGSLDIESGGVLNAASSASNITISGNWTNNGTFTEGTSTVTLNGTSQQTLSGTLAGSTGQFYNLIVTNASGTDASDNELTGFTAGIVFAGDATITNNYVATTAHTRVEYHTGSTYTLTNINWNGGSCATPIYFRNSATSGTWSVSISGTQTAVSFINVSRSNSSTPITATSSTDALNNTNWTFSSTCAGSPTFTQAAYRLGNNQDSTSIDYTGAPASNTIYHISSTGQAFRLRMLVAVDTATLSSSGQNFKLQFGQKTGASCASGVTYADVASGSGVIRYNDNATPTDGSALTGVTGDPTDGGRTIRNQTYEEANNFTNSQSSIASGEDGMWDFSLVNNSAPGSYNYCFQVVKADGTALDTYTVYPEVAIDEQLVFSLDSTSKSFGTITPGANPTTQATTLTTSTNSSTGYVVYLWSSQDMTNSRAGVNTTIPNWTGTNSTPTTFGNGSFGFGYTTDDNSLTGGTAGRFSSGTLYAGLTHTGPGDPVADRTSGPVISSTDNITYKLAGGTSQAAGLYSTVMVYVASVTF